MGSLVAGRELTASLALIGMRIPKVAHNFLPKHIVGVEVYTETLLRRATHPGIRFVGEISPERIAAFQQSINCQIVPSIWREDSPLTIHEAFLSGIPALVSNLGGSRELVRDGAGFTYEADDPNDLLRTLRRLYDKPGLARDLASSAPDVNPMDEHALELSNIYERLSTATDRGSLCGN